MGGEGEPSLPKDLIWVTGRSFRFPLVYLPASSEWKACGRNVLILFYSLQPCVNFVFASRPSGLGHEASASKHSPDGYHFPGHYQTFP